MLFDLFIRNQPKNKTLVSSLQLSFVAMLELSTFIADNSSETEDVVCSYYRDKHDCLVLTPSSFGDLLREPLSKYSIAIVDSSFSSGRALEALNFIKTSRPSLPVIFTYSQGTEEELCLKAFRLGARDCFIKPFNLIDMIKSIELILGVNNKENDGGRTNLLIEKYSESISEETISLKKIHPGIEKAKKFVEENFNKALSPGILAKIACKSKCHFCRIFKKQEKMTCSEYVNFVRVNKAKNLIRKNQLSIKEICYQVGYKDVSYFGRVFKNLEEISPSGYRSNSLPSKTA